LARKDCGRGYYSFFPRKQHESDTNETTTTGYQLGIADWKNKNVDIIRANILIAFYTIKSICLSLINFYLRL